MTIHKTNVIADTRAYVEDSAKIYITMVVIAIGSSIICIYISNITSTSTAVAPIPITPLPAHGMVVPFSST